MWLTVVRMLCRLDDQPNAMTLGAAKGALDMLNQTLADTLKEAKAFNEAQTNKEWVTPFSPLSTTLDREGRVRTWLLK